MALSLYTVFLIFKGLNFLKATNGKIMLRPVASSQTYYPPAPVMSTQQLTKEEEDEIYAPPPSFNPVFSLLRFGYNGIATCGGFCVSLLKSGLKTAFPPMQIELFIENPQGYLTQFEANPGECLFKLLNDFQTRQSKAYGALKIFINEYKNLPEKYACLTCKEISTKAIAVFHKLVFDGVKFYSPTNQFKEVRGHDFYDKLVCEQPRKNEKDSWVDMSAASKQETGALVGISAASIQEIRAFETVFERFYNKYYQIEPASGLINADENKLTIGELTEILISELVVKTNNSSGNQAASLWCNLLVSICQFQPSFAKFSSIDTLIKQLTRLLEDGIITEKSIEMILEEIKRKS